MSKLVIPAPNTSGLQRLSLIIAVLGLAGAAVVLFSGNGNFYQSYLMAYLFVFGISLGSLAIMTTQHMAGGPWGALIARPLEAAVSIIPVLGILFIPILFGINELFLWSSQAYMDAEPIAAAKSLYLNVPFFIARAVAYFVIWTFAAKFYRDASRKQDEDAAAAPKLGYRMRNVSGVWLMVFILTMTFAIIDWAMSLTPLWFSGIYPTIFMISQAITGMAVMIITVVAYTKQHKLFDRLLNNKRLQDLGNFLMAFIMFWAYVHISQLIIIWTNNVAETADWYVVRLGEDWLGLSVFLLVFGFFAPFLILLSRWVKRRRASLVWMSIWALVVQAVTVYWIIAPTFNRTGPQLTWADGLFFVGLTGVWFFFYLRGLSSRNLIPANDPRLIEAIMHGAPASGSTGTKVEASHAGTN